MLIILYPMKTWKHPSQLPMPDSWASLVAQTVKNPPAVREIWVGRTSWRRVWPPTPISCLENPHGQRSLAGYSPWGRKESDTTGGLSTWHLRRRSTFPLQQFCSTTCILKYGSPVKWFIREKTPVIAGLGACLQTLPMCLSASLVLVSGLLIYPSS